MLFSKTPKRDYFNPSNTHKPWFRERQHLPKHRNHTLFILVSILCFLLGVVVSPLSHAESGELIMQGEDGGATPAFLHSTDVDLQVNGMIAHVTYSQSFINNSDEWKHGVYTFPLNENAAINSMEMLIGDRVIRGKIKRKTEAKKAFDEAKKAGKRASLTQQQRPNLFTQHLANIAPGEKITVTLQYIQQVNYDNGEFSFHLPTTLTPRYIPGIPVKKLSDTAFSSHAHTSDSVAINHKVLSTYNESPRKSNTGKESHTVKHSDETKNKSEQEPQHLSHDSERLSDSNTFISGWALPTNEVRDADKITPFMLPNQFASSTNQLSFSATIHAGVPLDSINSSSHQLNWHAIENAQYQYRAWIDSKQVTMDKDVWLHWRPSSNATPQAAYFAENIDSDHYALVMLTPPQVNPDDLQDFPRDVTFIIDTSGSMGGRPIEDAKAALKLAVGRLDSKDRFNIVAFNSNYTKLFSQPTNTKPHNIKTALSFISELHANGGTEMAAALNEALSAQPKENYVKQVVFITDGAVGNETALFSLIQQKLGSARLFTVGIGSAPNSYFMTRAAQFGRGSYVFIDNQNNIQKEMQRLFTKLESPVLSNLSLTLPKDMRHSNKVEVYPKRLPDLYAGEPLLINLKASDLASVAYGDGNDKNEQTADNSLILSGTLTDKHGNIHQWQRSIQAQYSLDEHNNNAGDYPANAKPSHSTQNKGIATAWARKKIAALMDEKALGRDEEEVKNEIVNVAIPHNLITAYTSFVAIEEVVSRPQSSNVQSQNIMNLMPQGTQMRAVSYPQTSAGITFYLAIGVISLIVLLLFHSKELQRFLLKHCRVLKKDERVTQHV
ncbi:marine proteobacterial sortase target protein [Alteromonas portus]|uniref:Marine proteobacterial sortase target protein n=1 Tax=Alteromonas portus TaxID=2565549 RepID=A0A4U0ZIN0_9ALTE|nr:marine proteobacterial sortase target protein [Alteromonas portus]TKB03393.1 marine proteobacterial sortase target protein [Alteromonas portus]